MADSIAVAAHIVAAARIAAVVRIVDKASAVGYCKALARS